MKPTEVTDEMLMAYVDGELDPQTHAALEAAIDADPALSARLQPFVLSALAVRESFSAILAAEPPGHLVRTIREAPENNVVPFRTRIWRSAAMPLAAGLALAIGLGSGYFLAGSVQDTSQTGLIAGVETLATALAIQPSGTPQVLEVAGMDGQLSVLGSYPIADGLCRSFELARDTGTINGVGCDRGDGFTVEMALAGPPASNGFAVASDRVAQSLDAYLSAVGAGSPLSPDEEAERLGLD